MRRKRLRFSLIILGLAVVFYLFVREAQEVLSVTEVGQLDQLEERDCGVVLTGGPGRIREAFEILGQRKIKKLVVSGVYKEAQLHEIFPHLPFYPEISQDDIILEKVSGSTYGNAVQSLALVKTLRCQNILLITSQLHMYRAHRIFKRIFPESVAIYTYPVNSSQKSASFLDLSVETIKSMFYTVFGRVL